MHQSVILCRKNWKHVRCKIFSKYQMLFAYNIHILPDVYMYVHIECGFSVVLFTQYKLKLTNWRESIKKRKVQPFLCQII